MTLTIADAIILAGDPAGLDEPGAATVAELLLGGSLSAEEAARLLVVISGRGENGIELAALVRALLARAVRPSLPGPCFDLCGTGGSGLTRFNVSTTVAFALAALGVPVAKHGNRGSARANGSFDLLDALGVPFQLPPDALAQVFAGSGVCFPFARQMHPAVGALAPARKIAAQQVRRTIFNLAGPLANPCRPTRQIIGVVDERTARAVADAVRRLGGERAAVVRGHPGIDEVSICGPTHVWDVLEDHVRHQVVERIHQHGLRHEDLPGGDAQANAAVFHQLIDGDERGPLLDMIAVNAAAALDCWHGRPILGDDAPIREVREAFATGAVKASFERHLTLARRFAG